MKVYICEKNPSWENILLPKVILNDYKRNTAQY